MTLFTLRAGMERVSRKLRCCERSGRDPVDDRAKGWGNGRVKRDHCSQY